MATVTFTPYKRQNAKVMRDVIGYCCQEKKVYDTESGLRLVSGVDCDGENAFDEFMTTKDCYRKANGVFFYHYTQSFSPDEDITRTEAHEIALEFARQAWPGYEVMVATHCDARHPHSHFIVNSVSYVDGKKLRQPPDTLIKLRKLSDDICQAHKLSVLDPYEGGGAMPIFEKKVYKNSLRVGQTPTLRLRIFEPSNSNIRLYCRRANTAPRRRCRAGNSGSCPRSTAQ